MQSSSQKKVVMIVADFSQRALAIQPTGVRKMFDLAGDDVISFGLGEPDFQPPQVAIDAMHQAIFRVFAMRNHPQNHWGEAELRNPW